MAKYPCSEETKARIMARGDLRESEKIALIGDFPDGTEVDGRNDPRFADTLYLLQATREEVFLHWCYQQEMVKSGNKYSNPEYNHEQASGGGYILRYGKLAGIPLCVEVSWHKVMGQLFMSYEPCSQVVHWKKCETFVRGLCPNKIGHTNISNYHNLVMDIEQHLEAGKKQVKVGS